MNQLLYKLKIARRAFANWPWVVPDRLGWLRCATFEYRLRSGRSIRCRPRSTDSGEAAVVCAGVEYPADFVSRLRSKRAPVVFDLGANIGAFAVWIDGLLEGVGYRGFAFEPFTANAALLRANLESNRIRRFEVVESCVGGVDGRVSFDTSRDFDAVRIGNGPNGVSVDCVRLSTFARNRELSQIDLLKVDIEGAEFDVLERDIEFIERTVESFLIEVHGGAEPRTERRLRELLGRRFDLRTAGLRGNIVGGTRKA